MRRSPATLARRLLWTPSYAEPVGDAATRTAVRMKRWVLFLCIAGDVSVWWYLRPASNLAARPLDAFVIINCSLLALDLMLGEIALRRVRRERTWRAILYVSAVLVCTTVVVVIHITGSLTSYFVMAGVACIIAYRAIVDFRAGAIALATLVLLHAAALWLEAQGKLPTLFDARPNAAYDFVRFRIAAASSIYFFYMLSFVFANMFVNRFREKDIALQAAQLDAERAAEMVKLGRFSGRTLADRYELGELLGRGGMGEIYAAYRLTDGVEVAIKVLHARLISNETLLERFRREAEAAARLSGDRVARVLETGHAPEGEPFIVMERLRGEDLGALLRRRGRLPSAELTDLAHEIASALELAHAAGIVHRDLKPQNVFLTSDGRIVLLDFGISKIVGAGETLTQLADVLGSPGFMAPEQARGQLALIGPPVDVFALGAIAYRALTGRPAFPAGDLAAAIHDACYADPPLASRIAPDLPIAVDAVLSLALAKSATERYARPMDFVADLRAALAGTLPDEVQKRARALRRASEAAATLEGTEA